MRGLAIILANVNVVAMPNLEKDTPEKNSGPIYLLCSSGVVKLTQSVMNLLGQTPKLFLLHFKQLF